MKKKNCIYIILFTGYLVYFNSLFNGFVLDDLFQIVNNSGIVGWNNFFYFFAHEIGPYYRPIMLTTFSVFYNLGLNSFSYHFLQVSLHIINAVIVFSLIDSFLKKRQMSLVLALIFLVHPINVEAVVYTSELQETYFMFFGLLGLILLRTGLLEKKTFIIFAILQMLALLSKETAILFMLMQVILAYLFHKKYFFKVLLSSVAVILVYAILRLLLFGSITSHKFLTIIPNTSSTASFIERLINIPNTIFFYFHTLLFPKDLAVSQMWWSKTININNFYLPLLADLILLLMLVFLGLYVYKKTKEDFKIFSFFSVWLVAGLGLHSQIITLDWTVAERWFYFPIIGLLGLIGIGLMGVEVKKKRMKIAFAVSASIILTALSLRTIVRNTNWHDQLTLTSHDIKISKDSGDLELNLGLALTDAARYEDAIKHLERATELMPTGFTAWDGLGGAYAKSGNYSKAVTSFKKAISFNKDYYTSYKNLTILYIYEKKAEEAKIFLEKEALKKWPSDAFFWRMLGFANVLRKDNKSALEAFKKAYEISPDDLNLYYFTNLKENKDVILRL